MAVHDDNLTPMMRQFLTLKERHPEALLLFRCGDFYETYLQDAEIASKILGITLTHRRSNGSDSNIAMAGFPHHALDTYLPKLIRAGCRVAICDQLEDPKLTRKLVKRGITELVTPGVAMEDNVLEGRENNFLAAVHFGKGACGVAFLDISTGEFLVDEGTPDYISKLLDNFSPKEVLYNRQRKSEFRQYFGDKFCIYEMDDWVFSEQQANAKLLAHFNVKSLKGFGVAHLKSGVIAAGAIMYYLEYSQHTRIKHITSIARIEEERYVRIDKFTMKSLELLAPMSEGGTSLLEVIDRTATPMGGRLLRRQIAFPLKDKRQIDLRLDATECFFRHPEMRDTLDDCFRGMGDIERIISKAAAGRVNPREVVQLKNALRLLADVKEACLAADDATLQKMGETLDLCPELTQRIENELVAEPPVLVSKGNVIRDGFNASLDELRGISRGGRNYLLDIQKRETERTGIVGLKVGYNNVFGYYLEVRNTSKARVPDDWIRKQTLVQAERYITQELKEYEEKILGADEKILALEEKLFAELVSDIGAYIAPVQLDASIIAQLDCFLSAAATAKERHWVRPVVDDTCVLDIKNGRHPVIETQMAAGETYVPNDLYLDTEKQQIMIITGPNMAGKSALLRQTALIVLLAQTGCFVPADSARIGLVDKIFTRVGATDNISLGESTFMVEMTEAANILNNATNRSLILFDELGRGTSTYDGISIAWAIVEHLHENRHARARTLFATHYHELNEMEKHFERVKNYNVAVREADGQVIFLRKLERGGSEHSFGIHVAEIAGMPPSIVKRAKTVLEQLERENAGVGATAKTDSVTPVNAGEAQLSFFRLDDPVLTQIRDEILGLNIDNLTPVEALNKLNEIKRIITGQQNK
ncbi:MAG: DNA mismatch repair protein MutS [Prevotella sp.]|nr:DNA mismatch repair protein MutS [Prevotella sp.]